MKHAFKYIASALASVLVVAACEKENKAPVYQPGELITITATLAPKSEGAATRAVADNNDNKITVTWAVHEQIAILYVVGGEKKAADATVTNVNSDGSATISFSVDGATSNNTACTLVYPKSAAKEDNSGVKDAATLLASQDGTLNAGLDVRVGAGTIQTSTPGLTVTTQPAAQFAIFKFTTKNSDGSENINVSALTVTIGEQDYVITPASATGTFYAALPEVSSQTVGFSATGSDSKTYAYSKDGVSFTKGKFYQSTLKMTKQASTLSELKAAINGGTDCSGYVGWEVSSSGAIAPSGVSGTKIGYVAYVSSSDVDTGVSDSRILVLASADAGTSIAWGGYGTDSKTDVSYSDLTSTSLMNGYTCTEKLYAKKDTYTAAKAAWEYQSKNGNAVVTGSSGWFLPCYKQWVSMRDAQSGSSDQAKRSAMDSVFGLSGYYWSSTEYESKKAYRLAKLGPVSENRKNVSTTFNVRACFAY